MAPGLRSPPAESTASRTPRSLTLTLTIGSHGRGPRRDAPNAVGQSQAEHAAAREKQRQVGGRSPCLVRGRQRGPNNPRHSETAVQAGKNVLGRAALLHATRPHKDPPATLGRSSCVQTFPVPDPIPRGVILYGGRPPDRVGPHKVGLSLSPSNHAAVSLGRIDGRSVDGRVRSAAWTPATQSRSPGEPGACRAVAWPVTGAGWRQLAKSGGWLTTEDMHRCPHGCVCVCIRVGGVHRYISTSKCGCIPTYIYIPGCVCPDIYLHPSRGVCLGGPGDPASG